MTFNSKFNEAADFLYYEIGANPLPADTKNKRINDKLGRISRINLFQLNYTNQGKKVDI